VDKLSTSFTFNNQPSSGLITSLASCFQQRNNLLASCPSAMQQFTLPLAFLATQQKCLLSKNNATTNQFAPGFINHSTTLYLPVPSTLAPGASNHATTLYLSGTFFFFIYTHFAHCKGVLSPSFYA
jgi:hypothetical protein